MFPDSLITRFAPGSTGLLHLGNAWSFLIAWLVARANNGKIYLRIDDIDPQRSRKEYEDAILRDLEWLGLDWDPWQGRSLVRQTERLEAYGRALTRLEASDLIYPCFCSRKEIRLMAGAPHPGDEGAPYSGKCLELSEQERQTLIRSGVRYSLRFKSGSRPVEFADLIQGPQRFAKAGWGGDFALRRSDGVWAYQLASIVDDCEMGVNLIARGRDLLASTPRQIMLARELGYQDIQFAHLPLVLDSSGQRLAKRHQGLTLASLRDNGMKPEALLGLLAFSGGLRPSPSAVSATELLSGFSLELISPRDIFLPAHFFR